MRVLFVLSQRPELTGSGITLDSLVREAVAAGHEVRVLCGVPAGRGVPAVGGLPASSVEVVTFGEEGDLPFAVPGMSDVMPYRSSVWAQLGEEQLEQYERVWSVRLREVVEAFDPDVVHLNHLWIVSALAPAVLAGRPSVVHCHATGLRQMDLCGHLAERVTARVRLHDAFVVLHDDHARELVDRLGLPPARVHTVGAGFRTGLFHARDAATTRDGHLLFVGKFAAAKGLPWLLDALETIDRDGVVLHVAGDGAGEEAEALRRRMAALAPRVTMHGRLDQAALADLMRRCAVLVLPSFYEGLPLVLAEARACGCRLVSTALPGVERVIAPAVGSALRTVALPRRIGPDRIDPRDEAAFTSALAAALRSSLDEPVDVPGPDALREFTWTAVFGRVERVWRSIARDRGRPGSSELEFAADFDDDPAP